MSDLRDLAIKLLVVVIIWAGLFTAWNLPYDTDGPAPPVELIHDADSFYESAYEEPSGGGDSLYVEVGKLWGTHERIRPELEAFVADHGLADAKALEIGSGSGALQDVVQNYTGLDIAASSARYLHKPFVHASATELPFEDNSFDLIWTIWTLEHVPNPERALSEMRRVVRPGGVLYLRPAWNNAIWAPEGLRVRPLSELTWRQIARRQIWFTRDAADYLIRPLIRVLRLAASTAGPTTLHYRSIEPNFDVFYLPDSDAFQSIDCFEVQLWFETRGDRLLNLGAAATELLGSCGSVAVEVRKEAGATSP